MTGWAGTRATHVGRAGGVDACVAQLAPLGDVPAFAASAPLHFETPTRTAPLQFASGRASHVLTTARSWSCEPPNPAAAARLVVCTCPSISAEACNLTNCTIAAANLTCQGCFVGRCLCCSLSYPDIWAYATRPHHACCWTRCSRWCLRRPPPQLLGLPELQRQGGGNPAPWPGSAAQSGDPGPTGQQARGCWAVGIGRATPLNVLQNSTS